MQSFKTVKTVGLKQITETNEDEVKARQLTQSSAKQPYCKFMEIDLDQKNNF